MDKPFKLVGGVLGLAVAALGFVALSAQVDHRAFDDSAETKEALKWTADPPRPLDQKQLDREEWRAVIGHKESAAEAMLRARSWTELDDAKAKELTGGYAHPEGKTKPYLLRGLSSNSQAGGVSIWTNPNREVGVAGRSLKPLARSPA